MNAAPHMPTDHALVHAYRAGDDQAFATLYRRWRGRVRAYALKMLRSEQDADEVMTDAFVKVVEGRYQVGGSFKSYLFTVVHRQCLDRIRRRQTRGRVLPMFREEPVRPNLEAAIDGLRDRARVEVAMDALPTEHRAVLLLYYSQGLSSREVAEALGISDQQVRSKLSYARKALRRLLGEAP